MSVKRRLSISTTYVIALLLAEVAQISEAIVGPFN